MSQIWLDVTSKVNFLRIPLCSINLHELSVQIRQLLTFFPQNIKAFAKKFPKKPFVYFTPNSFWSLSCENLLEKTSLIGVRIWLKHFVDTIQGSRYCTNLLVDIWKPYPKSKWVSFLKFTSSKALYQTNTPKIPFPSDKLKEEFAERFEQLSWSSSLMLLPINSSHQWQEGTPSVQIAQAPSSVSFS